MTQYFYVKNLERFQHYKNRNPKWIKLYNSLLDDYDFLSLSDEGRFHLMGIWLLASRAKNRLPWDEEWLSARISAKSRIQLSTLKSLGFIDTYDDASKCSTNASLEKRESREEKKEHVRKKDLFLIFWEAYPKKRSKQDALKAFNSIKPDEVLLGRMLEAISAAKVSEQWLEHGGRFVPHPATWLRRGCWEDELTCKLATPPPPKRPDMQRLPPQDEVSEAQHLENKKQMRKLMDGLKIGNLSS